MNKFWWWIFKNEWIPLGRLAPYVLGLALKSKPHKVKRCLHKKTVCINEEGNAGVFCVDCGEQLEKEC